MAIPSPELEIRLNCRQVVRINSLGHRLYKTLDFIKSGSEMPSQDVPDRISLGTLQIDDAGRFQPVRPRTTVVPTLTP